MPEPVLDDGGAKSAPSSGYGPILTGEFYLTTNDSRVFSVVDRRRSHGPVSRMQSGQNEPMEMRSTPRICSRDPPKAKSLSDLAKDQPMGPRAPLSQALTRRLVAEYGGCSGASAGGI